MFNMKAFFLCMIWGFICASIFPSFVIQLTIGIIGALGICVLVEYFERKYAEKKMYEIHFIKEENEHAEKE